MRPHPVDSGWAGSLFDEPIEQVKPILTPLQFPETGPFPEDTGVFVHYAHETWVRFLLNGHLVEEFVSTEKPIAPSSEMAADMRAVDDAREAAGGLPRARCSVQNGIRTYEDPELWPDKAGLAASVGWAHQTCENNRSAHRGQACMPKNLNCPRGDGAGYCGFEMKQYETQREAHEVDVKSLGLQAGRGADGEFHFDARRCLMSECNGWRWYNFEVLQGIRDWVMDNGRNWHTGLRIGEIAVADPAIQEVEQKSSLTVDLERWKPIPTTEQWMLSNCGKHHSCRDDCAGRRSGALCPFVIGLDFLKDCVRQGDMPADLLDDRAKDNAEAKAEKKPAKAKKSKPVPVPAPFTKNDQEMQFLRSDIVAIDQLLSELPSDHVIERLGFESRKQEHEERLAILAPAVNPVKEPVKQAMPDGYVRAKTTRIEAKTKKQPKAPRHGENYCVLRGGDCSVYNGCQNGDVPCTLKDVPHLKEIHLPCEVHALLDLAIKPTKEPMAVLLDGKWYSDGKMLWDCSDCLCLACANEGKSCHDCKGFERCMKIGGTGGKIGACPDFRTEEGKEQHCLENGCLCFKCQLIGERCEDCPGPIRCDGPRMKCKEYVGTEVTT